MPSEAPGRGGKWTATHTVTPFLPQSVPEMDPTGPQPPPPMMGPEGEKDTDTARGDGDGIPHPEPVFSLRQSQALVSSSPARGA